ncbi:MAG: hypothetical protein JXA71_19580 [Chitinispirillaceae bacterium]|nr:hypothetical protein [Chitinispirillaceae bacterium]
MAITHPTAARNTLANAINTLVNAGSAAGKLKILTSGDALLATLTLADPAFGSASNGAIALDCDPVLSAQATGTGTAAKFTVTDSDDTIIYQGSVATSGGDLTIDNTSIVTGQTVNVTAHSYTAPA